MILYFDDKNSVLLVLFVGTNKVLNQITCYSQRQQPINVFGIKIKGPYIGLSEATSTLPLWQLLRP